MSARPLTPPGWMRPGLQVVAVVYAVLLTKLSIFTLIFLAYSLLPANGAYYVDHFNYPFAAGTLALAYDTWDAPHYLWLADHGYVLGDQSNAFYPLFPFLIHLVSVALRSTFLAGLLVANICTFVAAYLFYRVSALVLRDERLAMVALILLLAFPTAFYMTLIYTESLFLALACGAFLALMTRRLGMAAALSFLMPLARPVGMYMIVPLAVAAVRRQSGRGLRLDRSVWLVAAPVLGSLAYLAIMYLSTGNAMEGFDAVNRFGSPPVGPSMVLHPGELLHRWFDGPFAVHGYRNSIIDRALFVIFLLSLPLIWRLRNPALFAYSLLLGFVPLLGTFMSYSRYLLPVFPLFIALAAVLGRERWRFLLFPWLFASISLQALFIVMQALGYWVA